MLYTFIKTKSALFYILGIIILLRVYSLFLFPNSGYDGPIYLSHAFTILNGRFFQNDFLREYIPVFNFPYLYGFLNAPFYYLFKGNFFQTYSLLFWSEIWLLLFIYGAYRLLITQPEGFKKFSLFAIAYAINIYSNSTRSEIFILPFFILLLNAFSKAFKEKITLHKWVLAPLLIVVIGLMHPVAGVFACALAFVYATEHKTKWLVIVLFYVEILLLVVLFYLPVVLIDFEAWRYNFFETGFIKRAHSLTDFSLFLKYLFYNPSVAILSLIVLLSVKHFFKELLLWILPFFSLCYFHQSYYYHYLFVLLLWRLCEVEGLLRLKWIYLLFSCTIVYGFAFGIVWPLLQYQENTNYTTTYKNALSYLYSHEHNDETKKVWVPGDMAMPVIDKPNTRLHWIFLLDYKNHIQAIDTTNIFYFTLPSQWKYIKQYSLVPGTKLKVSTIIKPCKGLITISPHFDRSETLGLWKVEVVKN